MDKQSLICDKMSDEIVFAAKALITENGRSGVTVRKVLQKLGITNRVFYNRFHNIEEVLEIVYENTALEIRKSISKPIDLTKDFFEQIIDIVADTLALCYDKKKSFNDYFFQSDSVSCSNYDWWKNEIKRLISLAIERDLIKSVDVDGMSYAIWCFCRGYNADAVSRNIPRDEAINNFKYCFGFLLDGLRKGN